jgi:parvulin-like peptidyl-prolyl isomerase
MTFRTPRATPNRKRRSSMSDDQRQQILVTFGFIGVIVVAVAILAVGVGAIYYNDHLASVATVNGVSISKDQWNERQVVDRYRIDSILAGLQSAVSSGSVDQQTANQEAQYLQQQLQSLPQVAASELIDGVLQGQLAPQLGVTVTQADIDNQLKQEATTPEQRKVLAIFVQPGATPAALASPSPSPSASSVPGASVSPSASAAASAPAASPASSAAASPASSAAASPAASASTAPSAAPTPAPSTGPTDLQKAEAKASADAALAALNAGTSFAQVAKQYSTDPSGTKGGDYGYITATDTTDQAWVNALFKLPLNGTTGVILGSDGTYRIGRVTDIVPAKTDPNYEQKLQQAGVNVAAYRAAIRDDLLAQKLQTAVTDKATKGNIEQVHAWEIQVSTTDAQGNPITGPQIRASHILFSPKGDPSTASSVPASDPSWADAQKKAQAVADQLRAITDPTKRAAEFAKLAKSDSNDTTSGAQGGDLGWFTQGQMVAEFSAPLFTGTHTPDEIIGPVKTQYGYHVIMYVASRPSPQQRIAQIQKDLAAPGASFAAIAKANSDATDASSGGDMGWVAPLQLTQTVEDVLFGLKVGQVSAPQTQSDGIYLYEISQKESRPVDSTQLTTLQGAAFTNWYAAQKAKANIWQSPDIANATPPAS